MRNIVTALVCLLTGVFVYFTYKEYTAAQTTVSLDVKDKTQKTPVFAEVSGAVNKPGLFELSENSRVADLIRAADGLSTKADTTWISQNLNLAQKLADSQKIYIPFEWEIVESTGVVSPLVSYNVVDSAQASESGININQAAVEELVTLTGIGDAYAARIIKNRPFANLDDFRQRSQIPEKTINALSSLITF
ncbi:MAG: ComEA protein [candidate division WWE3 bacterium GW2011_GWA1_46_21]|uniref:ComEA protein n=3 Tax=Katanobacteria TaxID=422282 RepID=A0A0G1SBK1_UNCKA|nr:MAG: ComEA protein [candidate division WWE3 bacterium GW2011_GWA1_46_21]KKU48722.1 MAG: ComEA protein [candidate division WWE3 bacterium GW2011_GWA2_46_9]KKU57178.1 MAG: ComEA protein [candidate division WWE3 bacterium GW2011_GWB1_47_11]